jgi:hypothetical protein
MGLGLVLSFLATSAFAAWMVFYGGAEELEGSWASFFLVNRFGPLLSAWALKVYVSATWFFQLVFLLVHIF